MDVASLIRPLTLITIVALLMSVGLKVSIDQVVQSGRQFGLVARALLANFIVAPAAILDLVLLFDLPTEIGIGMLILGAAPFAPLAPAIANTAKGDVPAVAGLLVILGALSVIATPLLCRVTMGALPDTGELQIDTLAIVKTLVMSVMIPLGAGLAIHRAAPSFSAKALKPVSSIAQILLLALIVLVVVDQFDALMSLGVMILLAMVLGTEIPLTIGYALGGPGVGTRRSLALGTGVRNSALALLIATGSFPNSPVVLSVTAYAFLMIILGLVHAVLWGRRSATS